MNLKTLHEKYITASGIALDLGIPLLAAHTLTRRHTFPKAEQAFGRPVFLRAEYAEFKANHGEEIRQLQQRHCVKAPSASVA